MDTAQTDLLDFIERGRSAQAEVNSIIGKSDAKAKHRPRARKTDPSTSHRAAKRAGEKFTWSQRSVLECFAEIGEAGMTDPEFIAMYHRLMRMSDRDWTYQSESGLRTRRHELVEAGKLKAIGEWTGESGRSFTIWALNKAAA